MESFQDRVVYEKQELDDKITRLNTFTMSGMFFKLSADEKERMLRQLKIMKQYTEVLQERIEHFNLSK